MASRSIFGMKKGWREKIDNLFIFLDHVIKLNEEETEVLAIEITRFIEEEGPNMSLSLEDTSFAKYYKRVGKEEGRVEEKVEVARKMLKEGFPIDVIVKLTELSREEIEKLGT